MAGVVARRSIIKPSLIFAHFQPGGGALLAFQDCRSGPSASRKLRLRSSLGTSVFSKIAMRL